MACDSRQVYGKPATAPLVQSRLENDTRDAVHQPVKEKVYINALNGRLLVIRDKFCFENVASEDPTKIKDLDGVADFEERAVDPAMPDMVAPHLEPKTAVALGFKMFGVTADEVKLVLLPIWAFTTRVAGKWTAEVKYLGKPSPSRRLPGLLPCLRRFRNQEAIGLRYHVLA